MTQPLFSQNVIAVVWDFDKTLIPGYMQEPLFRLRELGSEVEFYPGLPSFLPDLRDAIAKDKTFAHYDVRLEHYVVSTGLRQMILGSKISAHVDGVWGCEFIESPLPAGFLKSGFQPQMAVSSPKPRKRGLQPVDEKGPVISQLAYVIDNTTKTRAIFEINKGSNKEKIDVNAVIGAEDRRVPFQNMIYIADGPSDVPVFSIIKQYGGRTFAVYNPDSLRQFAQVKKLQEQGRVQSFGPADYTEKSQTSLWIRETVKEIAWRIVNDRAASLREKVQPPPGHIVEDEGDVAAYVADMQEEGEQHASPTVVGRGTNNGGTDVDLTG